MEGDAVAVSVMSLRRAATSGWERPGEERQQERKWLGVWVWMRGVWWQGGDGRLQPRLCSGLGELMFAAGCLSLRCPSRNDACSTWTVSLPETPCDDEFNAERENSPGNQSVLGDQG